MGVYEDYLATQKAAPGYYDVDEMLDANKDKDFVQRIFNRDSSPTRDNLDGSFSSHRMADNGYKESEAWKKGTTGNANGEEEELSLYETGQNAMRSKSYTDYLEVEQRAQQEAAARENDKLREEVEGRLFFKDQLYQSTPVKGQEVNEPFLQFKLARLDKMQDKIDYLENNWENKPEGANILGLITKAGEPVVGYEKDGGWYAINEPGPSWMDIPAAPGELGAEFVATVAGTFSPTMKAKLGVRVMTEAFASITGKTVDEVIDTLTLDQTATLGEVAEDIATDAVWNVMGGRIGDVGERVVNMFMGKGFKLGIDATNAEKEAQSEAVRIALEMDLPAPAVGGEVISKAEQIGEHIGQTDLPQQRRTSIARALESFKINTDSLDSIKDTKLLHLINKAKGKLTGQALLNLLGRGGKVTSKEKGGRAVMSIWDDGGFADVSRVQAGKLYDAYFDAVLANPGITYDLSGVVKAATGAVKKYGLSAGETTKKVFGGLDGGPITNTVTTPNTQMFSPDLDPVLGELITKLKTVDALQAGNPVEATQALKLIRSQLMDLTEKTPMASNKTVSQGIAGNLLRAVDDALTTPSGGPAELVDMYRRANGFWKKRAEVLDAFTIADARGIGAGEKVYNGMKGRITAETAKTLREVLAPDRYKEFQTAMIWDMLKNPSKIKSMMDDLGDAGRHLVPRKTREILALFQKDIKNVDTGVLSYALNNQSTNAAHISNIIEKASPGELKQLIKGGAIKEADVPVLVFQDFLEKTLHDDVIIRDGVAQINPTAFVQHVKKIKRSGMWEYLTPGQKAIMSDLQHYTSFMKGADAGTSIAAADIVTSQLTPFTDPGKAVRGRTKMWQIGLIAKSTTSKAMTKVLAGIGGKPNYQQVTRTTILSILNAINQIGDEVRTDGMGFNNE